MPFGEGTFLPLIDLKTLIDHADTHQRISFDPDGVPIDLDERMGLGPASLIVEPVTDAVKLVDTEDKLVGVVDKSELWEGVGFSVRTSVVAEFAAGPISGDELIRLVSASGTEWSSVPAAEVYPA